MKLKKALAMLSKSSPYAVSTVHDSIDPELEAIKKYLYVETDIEKDFKKRLDGISSHEILFLCGSSGDGKSEILTRYRGKYDEHVDFHLDATHSFEPESTAIETLDNIFSEFKKSDKPLVVGINVGMLGNYESEGDEEHSAIKSSMKAFLEGERVVGDFQFVDFEAFPKFRIIDGEVYSDFFTALLRNIVKDDKGNPFRDLIIEAMNSGYDKRLVANILLLRDISIQKRIIELLFCARIRKDQFITARMLLDFIYCILTGPGYLFDNIFSGGKNELLAVMADFDPSIIRNKELDLFVIHRTLGSKDNSYERFLEELASSFNLEGELLPSSMIRCLYLLKDTVMSSDYHSRFSESFNEKPLSLYKKVWQIHKDFEGDSEGKLKLKEFYNEIVLSSINKYANRSAPYLSKDEFYISSHGGLDLSAEVDIAISYELITKDIFHDISEFNLHIKVNDDELPPVPINVNLLAMMMDIANGFRPNRHNKNSVVLLDELVSKITRYASNSNVLFLYKNGVQLKLKDNLDGDIRVSGL
jgi:DNA phosphorothioation-dependent restriction protein DptF